MSAHCGSCGGGLDYRCDACGSVRLCVPFDDPIARPGFPPMACEAVCFACGRAGAEGWKRRANECCVVPCGRILAADGGTLCAIHSRAEQQRQQRATAAQTAQRARVASVLGRGAK